MELKYSLGVCQEGLQKNEAGRKKLRHYYTMFLKTVRTGGSLENNRSDPYSTLAHNDVLL
jgi:hypothetical protein